MMKRAGLMLAGLSALALANTALATEPTVLNDAQLDNVSAAYASVWSNMGASTGGQYVYGYGSSWFNLDDGYYGSSASINADLNTTSYGYGTTSLYLGAGAQASNYYCYYCY